MPATATAGTAKAAGARAAPGRQASRRRARNGASGRAPAARPARARVAAAGAGTASPGRVSTGGLIPVAVGRTAEAVRHIPDAGLIQGLARGRAWIAVLAVLLAGIVALNVAALSFTASAGRMDQRATELEQENSALRAQLARQLSNGRVEAAALGLGMVQPATDEYAYRTADEALMPAAAERISAMASAER